MYLYLNPQKSSVYLYLNPQTSSVSLQVPATNNRISIPVFLCVCTSAQYIHCNTLQHTATGCNTLQHTATHCISIPVLLCPHRNTGCKVTHVTNIPAATHCNTLQHNATHCNTLQHIATVSQYYYAFAQVPKIPAATHCNTLQHTAAHCNTLQHTATHCNTLQHTATHCNTLHSYPCITMHLHKCPIYPQHNPIFLQEYWQQVPQGLYIFMGWLRLIGSLQVQVSFAEYRLFYRALLPKRPALFRSLLIVAPPYTLIHLQKTTRPPHNHKTALQTHKRALHTHKRAPYTCIYLQEYW